MCCRRRMCAAGVRAGRQQLAGPAGSLVAARLSALGPLPARPAAGPRRRGAVPALPRERGPASRRHARLLVRLRGPAQADRSAQDQPTLSSHLQVTNIQQKSRKLSARVHLAMLNS